MLKPLAAVVSLALPPGFPDRSVESLIGAIGDLCRTFDCTVVGGDTNAWPQPLVVDVSMLAEPFPEITPVGRDGGQPGQGLFVTGALGGSQLGKHLSFTPRVNEAREIAARVGRPRAVRAVGGANGANPLPLFVPCHRVIGTDGALRGYGGGLAIKAALLHLEAC